jgi:hypothetical protein
VIADIDVDTSGNQQSTWTLTHVDGAGPGADDELDSDVVSVVDPVLSLNPSDSATLMGFVPAESGGDEQFRLSGARNGGVPLANLRATISAIWLPFDAST